MNKNMIGLTLVMVQLMAVNAQAIEKKFSCNGGELSVTLETELVDPENSAGTMDDERADVAYNLFQTNDVSIPNANTLYLIQGKGNGDTDFFFISIPNALENAKKGSKLLVSFIEKNDQDSKPKNPQGISRASESCTVEQ